MNRRHITPVLTACLSALLVAPISCREQVPATETPVPSTTAADSQYTAGAMIARFRATVPAHPLRFDSGGATTRDALVSKFVRALDQRDTITLAAMRISVSEFAWLTYLEMPQSRPPYELDPDILWMQLTTQSDKGLNRLLQRLKGQPFGFKAVTCQPAESLGTIQMHRCEMSGRDLTIPLSMLEREGAFKFTGYANRL